MDCVWGNCSKLSGCVREIALLVIVSKRSERGNLLQKSLNRKKQI